MNRNLEQHHTYIYTLPLYFTKEKYNGFSSFLASMIRLNNPNKNVEFIENAITVTYITLDTERRDVHGLQHYNVNYWIRSIHPIEVGKDKITIRNPESLYHPTSDMIFMIKPKDGPFIRIKKISMQFNDSIDYFDIGGDTLLYESAMNNEYTDKYIYKYRQHAEGELIMLNRIDIVTVDVTLYEKLDVAAELYIYANVHNILYVNMEPSMLFHY